MLIFTRRRRAARLATTTLLMLSVAVLIAGCGGDDDDGASAASRSPSSVASPSASPTQPDSFPFTFTDSSGETISFSEAPKRILSYSPAATEVLYAIGAGSQVVAVDEFSNYPPEVAAKQTLKYSKPAPEPALTENPDLVIMATRQQGQVQQFRSLGMRVVLLGEPKDLVGVLEQIRAIGRMTGHGDKAGSLAAGMQKRIDAVKAKVTSVQQGPRVFYELTPDLYTVAPDSFIGSLLQTLKARNVAEGSSTAFPQLSAEVVIAQDPEVILLADGSPTSGGQSPETVRARPGWGAVAAVKDNRIHAVDPDVFSRPGPRIIDALEQLARLFYPDR